MSAKDPRSGSGQPAKPRGPSPRKDRPRSAAPPPPKAPAAPDAVDEASDESFPASDPPSWTETTASRDGENG